MKRILKVVFWVVCVYAGLMLASGFAIKAMLSGSRIQQLFSSLNQRLPVTISAQGGTFDTQQLGSVENKIKNVMGGETTASGATDFVGFDSRFEVKNGQLFLSDILLKNSSSSVSGQGRVGFDHSMEFDLITGISGSLAARLGGKPDSAGQAQLRVPVKVRGTLEAAKVYPDVAGMAKAQAVERGKGLLDSFIKKRTAAQPK